MIRSNVIRFALLAVSANKNDAFFQQDYQAGLVALGLYELQAQKAIVWNEDAMCHISEGQPVESAYLRPLYEAIQQSSSKTLDSILFTVFTQYVTDYTGAVESYLKQKHLVSETVKKGRFGIANKKLEAEQAYVDESRADILALCSGNVAPAQWVLAKVLLKTGLIYDCFDKQEVESIKEKLQRKPDIPELHVCEKALDIVDRACSIGISVLATMILS